MFEQQSEFAAQASPSSVHSGVPHLPFQQPSEQQSIALVHAPLSITQTSAHLVTLACPNTGSQRPLQHALFFGSQAAAGKHAACATQTPFEQLCEQHSVDCEHWTDEQLAPSAWHIAGAHLPALHCWEQQSPGLVHDAPLATHAELGAHVPP